MPLKEYIFCGGILFILFSQFSPCSNIFIFVLSPIFSMQPSTVPCHSPNSIGLSFEGFVLEYGFLHFEKERKNPLLKLSNKSSEILRATSPSNDIV